MPDPSRPTCQTLALFESKRVVDTTVKCSGTITHVYGKPARELRQGEVMAVVAIVRVGKITFDPADDDTTTRQQELRIQEVFELDLPEVDTRRLLSQLRAKVRTEVEARYAEVPAESHDESGAA
jgi:hypothetical protein